MDVGENSYLLFFSAGYHFLLPLSCVKRVTDMKERDPDMPLADCLELSGQAYLIIADCAGRELGIGAEDVTGLVQVKEEQIYALPEAVRSSRNRYVDCMAAVGTDEGEGEQAHMKLAFIITPGLLMPGPVQ